MNELNKLIEQSFDTNSDCYADTWTQDGLGAPMVEGDVIRAMTLESFKKAVGEILASRPTCGQEQRLFLDEVEKLEYAGNGLEKKNSYYLAVVEDQFTADLQKVAKGE